MTDLPKYPRVACLLIGDELLSGRTRDSNSHHLAQKLHERGLPLIEVRVVPDEEISIVKALRSLKKRADIVFTSGGIGPTHDDITADAVASALQVQIGEREDAMAILRKHYAARGEDVTDARRRMARIPDGAELIENGISGAPGFSLKGVYVMAGVPAIFEDMLARVLPTLPEGPKETVYTVAGTIGESQIADGLKDLQIALKGLKIGSYPGPTGQGGQLSIVCSSHNPATAEQAALAVKALFSAQGVDAEILEGRPRQS
ncbi:competence/damage-inducible protein A [Parvularcula sp. ZS-1/3]|uniref:Competence/damage-inducible protein A n=1 Tax=Parvularcula mediterranea TaxID=2732508 RepID=A0A7Y3W5E6_9PROT|nr:molybdopterin-binding protein [Parvularcula mediterranea]NNU16433.1 competence/damage-inducible protein A [Parvularcula mediterranea]